MKITMSKLFETPVKRFLRGCWHYLGWRWCDQRDLLSSFPASDTAFGEGGGDDDGGFGGVSGDDGTPAWIGGLTSPKMSDFDIPLSGFDECHVPWKEIRDVSLKVEALKQKVTLEIFKFGFLRRRILLLLLTENQDRREGSVWQVFSNGTGGRAALNSNGW